MPHIPLENYLTLSAALFAIGIVGFLVRRNPITMLMAIELMWNAGNLAFAAFARNFIDMSGQIFIFIIITVAAAEAAIALAIVVMVFRRRADVDVDDISILRG
ncbi:MAG: NADH-quinone oxidoreductase subunit NuoK [Candidatus Eremiobacteraeota bacterium]|nr:NADH-quinone oxidoreductase subunit NuoK [Candidatus Eremiobacteraeota bacterium]MBC5826840.1 NADH-quinone oxidoreductase subunit NuoK [Candidatus Eremiobacteraeota bacterium]